MFTVTLYGWIFIGGSCKVTLLVAFGSLGGGRDLQLVICHSMNAG